MNDGGIRDPTGSYRVDKGIRKAACDLETHSSAVSAARSRAATWNFPRGTVSTRCSVARRCRDVGTVAKWAKRDPHAQVVVVVVNEGDVFEVAADEQRALPVGARVKKGGCDDSRGFAAANTIESDDRRRDASRFHR